ncbi:transcriptional regulator BetI [Aquibaculum sediminis]|uniref:transcriptional regulator BetI n=1 Tax=Aquibaculum sediminis TaxID=3231907 RepID=UPI003452B4FD
MPKVGVEELRRRQLIAATIESIHDVGFAATTLQSISRRAGVSSGLVAHYFRDKNGLLEATLRSLASDLSASIVAKLRRARTPRARLEAVISGLLAPEQFEPRIARVWLAFWGQLTHSPGLKRVQHVYEQRLLSNLRYALRSLLPGEEAERQAIALAAMIDGLWLRAALSRDTPQAEQSQRLCLQFVDTLLRRERLPCPAA